MRCPICNGAKQIMGCGFIYKECTFCEGSGTVDNEPEQIAHKDDSLKVTLGDLPIKRRGRPKKSTASIDEVTNEPG